MGGARAREQRAAAAQINRASSAPWIERLTLLMTRFSASSGVSGSSTTGAATAGAGSVEASTSMGGAAAASSAILVKNGVLRCTRRA